MPPLLVAPPPQEGEALSSWVHRLAARYDMTLLAFIEALNVAAPGLHAGTEDDLDTRPWPGLDAALARATRRDPAEVAALRPITGLAHTAWLRPYPAWCEACVEEDMARDGEVHLRAAWRTAACACCPRHRSLLRSAGAWQLLDWTATPGTRLTAHEGRLHLLRSPPDPGGQRAPAAAPPGWDAMARLLLAPGELTRVLTFQEALGAALAGRASPKGGDSAVPGTSLPAVCEVLLAALASRSSPPGHRPVDLLFMLLTTCASTLEVLSGRAPVRTLTPSVPRDWLGCETADLGEIMLALEPAALDRLVADAAAVGGAFARAAACAAAWIRLVRAAELRATPDRLASAGCWPMLFLANPTERRPPELRRWKLGLNAVARRALHTAGQACVDARAMRPWPH